MTLQRGTSDNKLGTFEAYQKFGEPAGENYILDWIEHMNCRPRLPEIYVIDAVFKA